MSKRYVEWSVRVVQCWQSMQGDRMYRYLCVLFPPSIGDHLPMFGRTTRLARKQPVNFVHLVVVFRKGIKFESTQLQFPPGYAERTRSAFHSHIVSPKTRQ